MKMIAKTAIALGFFGAMALGTTAPVKADGFYFSAPGIHIGVGGHRHYWGPRYYDYAPDYSYGYDCPPGYTVQDGLCRPYRGY